MNLLLKNGWDTLRIVGPHGVFHSFDLFMFQWDEKGRDILILPCSVHFYLFLLILLIFTLWKWAQKKAKNSQYKRERKSKCLGIPFHCPRQRKGCKFMRMYIRIKFPFCLLLFGECFLVALICYNNNLNIKQKWLTF